MGLKSLEDLKKIREQSLNKVKLRDKGEGDHIEILVGMATCGIASGARETLNAIVDEIAKEHIDNVKIVQVGCVGYCHSEPCVQVNIPGEKPVLYGKIDANKGREIVKKHIKEGKLLEDSVLDIDFQRV